jgi:ABC-type transport system substrate-binding protein
VTIAGIESRRHTLELVQAQLRRVGVEVRPEYALFDDFFGTLVPNGDFDLALYAYGVGASTSGPGDTFECQKQPDNTTGYCDRLVSRDLDRATRILDDRRRIALLNGIDGRLATAVPALPLYQTKELFALDTTVRGVIPNGAGVFTWNAQDWWLAEPR